MPASRRQLLRLCAALLIQPLVPRAAAAGTAVADRFGGHPGDRLDYKFLQHFAACYEAALPHEANVSALTADLFDGADGADEALLAERIRADFRRYNTVHIDGWLLSRTEARLVYLLARA